MYTNTYIDLTNAFSRFEQYNYTHNYIELYTDIQQ